MKRLLVVLLISGCTAIDDASVDQQQQALGGVADFPDTIGDANSRLGACLSTCAFGDGNLVMASAPGVRKIYALAQTSNASAASPNPFDNAGSIACASADLTDGGAKATIYIASPSSQSLTAGLFNTAGLGNAKRVAATEKFGAFVIGSTFHVGNVLMPGGFTVGDAGHLLTDLAFESPSRVLVTPNDEATIRRFTAGDGGGMWVEGTPIYTSFSGSHLAVGNISPYAGTEIIVSGTNGANIEQVQIFGADGVLLDTLTGTMGFGKALAIEKNARAGLDALWVGQPGTASVWRFLGDAGTQYAIGIDPASEAGAAIAVTAAREVWVGAPGYAGGKGAVYLVAAIDAGISQCFTNGDCGSGQQCSSGVCVPIDAGFAIDAGFMIDGGLVLDGGFLDGGFLDAGFIDAGFIDAGFIDAGIIDAGIIDAGSIDAGIIDAGFIDAGSIDAGSIDAGSIDAGSIDAGFIDAGSIDAGFIDAGSIDAGSIDAGPGRSGQFQNSGCSSIDAVFALMSLALIIRRKRT